MTNEEKIRAEFEENNMGDVTMEKPQYGERTSRVRSEQDTNWSHRSDKQIPETLEAAHGNGCLVHTDNDCTSPAKLITEIEGLRIKYPRVAIFDQVIDLIRSHYVRPDVNQELVEVLNKAYRLIKWFDNQESKYNGRAGDSIDEVKLDIEQALAKYKAGEILNLSKSTPLPSGEE